jgi:hypothetical protein
LYDVSCLEWQQQPSQRLALSADDHALSNSNSKWFSK